MILLIFAFFLLTFNLTSADAAIRWVSVAGGLSDLCNQANHIVDESSTTDPGAYQTFAQAKACMAAGDIMVMKMGDYRPTAIIGLPSGSSGNPTIVRTENAAGQVIVSGVRPWGDSEQLRDHQQFIGYVVGGQRTFKIAPTVNFTPTGTNCGAGNLCETGIRMDGGSNFRFENIETVNHKEMGIFQGVDVFGVIEYINIKASNNGNGPFGSAIECEAGEPDGPGYCHGIYLSGSGTKGATTTIIDGGEWDSNNGYGIHICSQSSTNVTVKNVKARNNYGHGVAFCSATNSQVYNSIITGNGFAGIAIFESPIKVYSNTVDNNGLSSGGGGIWSRTGTSGQEVKNNLSIGNNGTNVICTGSCLNQNNTTTGTAASHFANAANGDFRLCTGAGTPGPLCTTASTALNLPMPSGCLGSPWNVDLVGTSRPQGTGCSAGAYEETGTTPTPVQFALKLACDGNVNDTSGNGNHGSLVAGATASATGKYNQACSFDPTLSQHIQISDSNSLDMTTAFTLAAWVLVPGPQSALRYIIAKENIPQGFDGSYYLAGSSSGTCGSGGNFGGYIQGGTAILACHSVVLPSTPAWTHLAVTYNAQSNPQVAFYKNGTIVNTNVGGAAVLTPGTGPLFIGSGNGDGYFSGLIDEVWIFQGAIPATGAFDSNCTTNASDPNSWSINRVMNCSINPVTPTPGAPTGVKVGGAGSVKIGGGGIVRMGQ